MNGRCCLLFFGRKEITLLKACRGSLRDAWASLLQNLYRANLFPLWLSSLSNGPLLSAIRSLYPDILDLPPAYDVVQFGFTTQEPNSVWLASLTAGFNLLDLMR